MASKRKRDTEDEAFSTPNSKIAKQDEVTRSGRVRKKPAKFVDDLSDDIDGIRPEPAPAPKPIPTPKAKLTPAPAASPALVIPSQLLTKIVTIPDPAQLEEEELFDIKGEEDTPSTARSGRARKKSAKVLEMEEFEEAEKKQTSKKDVGKKVKSPTSPVPGIKSFPKSPTSGVPTTVAKLLTSPVSSMKIKDIQPPVKAEAFSPEVSVLPVKVSPVHISPSSTMTASTLSPPAGGKGSVIKLLLSSPSQAAKHLLSPGAAAQTTPAPEKSTKKKSKPKEKTSIADDHAKLKQALEMAQQGVAIMSPSKQNLALDTGTVKAEGSGKLSLKLKLSQIQKEDRGAETSMVKVVTGSSKSAVKESKPKKGKKSIIKEEPVFMPPPLPSPNVIHVGSMSLNMEGKSELEQAQKKKVKTKIIQEKQKAKDKLDIGETIMEPGFGLDMADINLAEPGEDSFMDMDDDDSLIIPEEELEVKAKTIKKKKTNKGKTLGKLAQPTEFGDIPTDSDLVMDFSRMKSDEKKKKKKAKEMPEDVEKGSAKKKRPPTAYMLWCYEHRPKVVMENPGIDFSTISKTLGEMWSSLPKKEKMVWKRKSKKAAGKGSTLITTGKTSSQKPVAAAVAALAQPTASKQVTTVPQKPAAATAAALLQAKQQAKQAVEDITMPIKGFGIEPVDVAAHLKIVGESLSIIGMRLQEHRGLIAVQGSLSVLLDSMLCAVSPLLCLTSLLPETNGLPRQTHMKNLDNIAYVMPGL